MVLSEAEKKERAFFRREERARERRQDEMKGIVRPKRVKLSQAERVAKGNARLAVLRERLARVNARRDSKARVAADPPTKALFNQIKKRMATVTRHLATDNSKGGEEDFAGITKVYRERKGRFNGNVNKADQHELLRVLTNVRNAGRG